VLKTRFNISTLLKERYMSPNRKYALLVVAFRAWLPLALICLLGLGYLANYGCSPTNLGVNYLQPISGGEVELPAREGKQTIANNGKTVFTAGIDEDFIRCGANESGVATPETRVRILELVKDADFATMFGSLAANVETLCLTQDQIISFVENHPDELSQGATFFLFKSKDQLFVAYVVQFDRVRLLAYIYRFEFDHVWRAGYPHRVVVLKPEA